MRPDVRDGKTVRLSDFSPYDRDKGKTQELRHKFRNQILEGNYIPVYTSL